MTLFTTSRPKITIKALPRFPASVTADGGLSITKTGGNYNFGFDYSTQTLNTSLSTPANWTMLAYNSGTGLYEQVRLDAVVDYTIQPRRAIGDQNETLTANDRYVALTASLSTARTWTLPAANSVSAGVVIRFQDEAGGISSTNTLTFARAGSDTINGGTSLVVSSAYGGCMLISNGTDKWSYEVVPQAASLSAKTSAEIAAIVSDETGSGLLVFGTGPTLTKPKLASASLSSPAVAGEIEYDAKVGYLSPVASNRGVLTSSHLVVLTSGNTLTSTTSAQPIFDGGGGSANGALTLPVGAFFFDMMIYLSSLSVSSANVSFVLAGTATLGTCRYRYDSVKGSASSGFSNVATSTVVTASDTTTTAHIRLSGIIVVTGTGTIIPQVALGAAAAASVASGSFFRCNCIGADTVTTIGNWS